MNLLPEFREVSTSFVPSDHISFSEEQNKAIYHTAGPCEIIAGPGSGKTAVLVHHLLYLIRDLHVDPSSILVLTFSRAAAKSMQQRFIQISISNHLSYSDICRITFGTFHSVFYHILNEHHKCRLIGTSELTSLLNHLHKSLPAESWITASDLAGMISCCKNTGRLPDKSIIPANSWSQIYGNYIHFLKENRLIDFDDMILECRRLLKENPELLQIWQSRWKYFLVDEFQDINDRQYEILELLAGNIKTQCTTHSPNLYVVGDDDQSIYGFRGSSPAAMIRFQKDHADCNLFRLETNYRCSREIVDASVKVISINKNRINKDIRSCEQVTSNHETLSSVSHFTIQKCTDLNEQYEQISEDLLRMTEKELDRTAVIVRANVQAQGITDFFMKHGIPISGSNRQIDTYSQKKILENKEIISAYRAASEDIRSGVIKRKNLFRIMNRPCRYITRDIAYAEIMTEKELIRKSVNRMSQNRELMNLLKDLHILSGLKEQYFFRYLSESMHVLSPEELKKINQSGQPSDSSQSCRPDQKGVHILTMHASKGLEFDTVYVPELNEGMIPSRKVYGQDGIEEERRLLYVAMTRAKKKLTLIYLSGTAENPRTPSRFLEPLGVKLLSNL